MSMSLAEGLTVAVFSFNRGGYLKNCLDSLARNLPFARVVVYDDGSTEAETLAVLAGAGEAFSVRQMQSADRSRHGGLYPNMQAALDECETDLLFFLQDDMQLVRPVAPEEPTGWRALLAADPDRAFLYPCFLRGLREARHRRRLRPDAATRSYISDRGDAAVWAERSAYYDVCIADVARLRAADWHFASSEHENLLAARARFADMPFLGDPIAFHCPEVPIFRNRSRTFAARLAARHVGTDVKAFLDMTPEQVADLKSRPLTDWPVAETYLTTKNPKVRRPFVYKDVKARWWLNLLHRAEKSLRG